MNQQMETIETIESRTVADVRRVVRKAKTCAAQVTISGDASIEVEVSKAAVLRAIAEMPASDPCGGVLFVADAHFLLDGYGL